ncbi:MULTISPECIES: TetR/AcrR family transcriptional regulator [Gordonia]|uniref:TetR/AcrR family transcriptional regulator n=2 Tax=Gordonia TaxID=2053 RepID=A0ABN3H619_9ACTN|nr:MULTISPECIES: TetR/AcrR family transcriptional regulator [Gordonia]AUH68273.1 TetR/AcrR family transcriptional regulator [Gordonia sp. YC-JH1]KJR06808.1 TetR family transcriptional regulator [Gordonia sihwensis]KXT56245.1 TetR family transcriptional regulator [Gordonia sp. QH-12]MBY4569918.1 TetR family transcriptional regulator [Gordonia sihwensis]WFN91962.1 TetR/AcrR family transcriptional regulator [Gordonia sihwensis]
MHSLGSTLPRRGLNARQLETVGRLLDAGLSLLEESAYEDLTLRLIAAGANVSPATAYTYFSSKDHLFASLFWRQVAQAPEPELSGEAADRLHQTVRYIADVVGASPTVAEAATKSLLAVDPDVARIRVEIGTHWYGLFTRALGEDVDPAVLRTLMFTFSGALLEAGMGVITYDDLFDQLDSAVTVIARGNV